MKHFIKQILLCTCIMCFVAAACRHADKKAEAQKNMLAKPPFASITDSISLFPGDALLYLERAQLLSQNNLHETATADYKKLWELNPTEITAVQYASNLAITNKPGEATRLLESGIKRFPESINLKKVLGEIYIQAGNDKEALQLYDGLLKHDPVDFETWYEKGMLLAKMKDTTQAIEALKHACAIQPVSTYALELAHLYAETSNAAALQLCDLVINKDSARDLIDPFFIKGIYYSNTRQYDSAVIQFDSCIHRDWKFTEAYIEKGMIFFKQKNYDVAINTFRMAATVSNTYADAYYWIGRCYEAINKKDDAIEYYEKAIALDKNFTEAREAVKRLKS